MSYLFPIIAFSTSLIFAFSKTFWSQAVVSEVYTLNAFFIVLLLYLTVLFSRKQNLIYVYMFAFFSGLSLSNHHTMLLMIGICGLFFIYSKRNLISSINITRVTIYFLLGVSLYFYLIIRANANPSMNWGNPSTLSGLWDHIARGQYGNLIKIPRTLQLFISQMKIYFISLFSQFTWFLLVFAVIGIYQLWKKDVKKFVLICLLFIGYSFFVTWLLNPRLTKNDIDVQEAFYTPSYIMVSVFIGYGIFYILKLMGTVSILRRLFPLISCFLVILPLTFNYYNNDLKNNFIAYDYGKNILSTPQKNSVLFISQDNEVFIAAYLKKVEKFRPDLLVYEDLGVVFDNIYGADYLKISVKDHLIRRKNIQMKFLSETNKPVYCLYTTSMYSWINDKKIKGVLFLVKGDDKDINYSVWERYSMRGINEEGISKEYLVRDIICQYYFSKGEYFLNEKSFDKAEKEFNMASVIGYDITWVQNNIGLVYERMGLAELAILEYKKAIENNPYSAKAHYNLGLAYSKKKLLDDAEKEYLKAIEIKKDYPDALNNLGNLYLKKSKYYKAADLFKQCLSIEPYNISANYNLGIALNETGSYDEAISYFERVISIEPNYKEAYNNIGVSYMLKGNRLKAREYWQKALSIDPNFPDPRINLEHTQGVR